MFKKNLYIFGSDGYHLLQKWLKLKLYYFIEIILKYLV